MSILLLTRRIAAFAALISCVATAEVPPQAPATGLQGSEPADLEAELRQRADAQFSLGDVAAALSTYGVLEGALTGAARSSSRDALWQALNNLPADTDFSKVTDPTARGWIELMQLVQKGAPLAAYEDWRRRYPDHPGESQMAAGLVTRSTLSPRSGKQIALLLPAAGPLAPAAKAILAGADAARNRIGADAPTLLRLDSSTGVEAGLEAALAHGASAVIGPLRKEDVAGLVARPPPLPTISLNYLDAGRMPPTNLAPFGLAPEDEARAAADEASSRSLLRAVIFAQDGDWGSRAANAFRQQFERRGGTVIGAETFKANAVDFITPLKRLLGVTYSEARGAKLAAAGVKADLQPVPRGDIDVVYLAARSAQAKLIWPQMRYLRAGRIATYAPGTAADAGNDDLGGLNVCDVPWLIDTQGRMAALRGELAAVNPRTADAQRLFALGFDAYELARRYGAGVITPGESLPGLTGSLVLEADGAVHRHLDCVPLYSPRDSAVVDN